MDISPAQIRAARALLRMERDELAARAQVPVVEIEDMEGSADARISPATLRAVRHALEAAGIEFIAGGVRPHEVVRPDAEARIARLRAISQKSAAELAGHEILTEDDLYDENGIPW